MLTACGQPLQVTPGGEETVIPFPLEPGTTAPAQPTEVPSPTPASADATASPPPTAAEATAPPPTSAPEGEAPTAPAAPTPGASERAWRAQQEGRQPFPEPRIYIARTPVTLLWFDPMTGQSLEIGTLAGPFTAQAEFTFMPENAPALEVPYRINEDFGLTAISPAVQARMAAAGYTDTVEAYVLYDAEAIQIRQ